ncbi:MULTISPECIES: flagellin [Leifsonia]|uniref:flagellin N-terminal helical domain-containing protein n=1 Tax=Leifsonia TaxID=110932 RepID=UPI001AA0DCE2|nr:MULTISPECIES: flagellin [Leifsonia]MBN9631033.1 flagellin [Actinomycetota bacterium]MBO1737841.1 flagellin [Leifsonia sp. TF02-11]MCI0156920.1 flagellin [Leifsonia shinshuensis]
MGMQINTNISALNAYRNLNNTQSDLSKSLEKLSSGLRINRAADDAAGLAISEGLKSQVGGLTVAARNAQDGISVVQTAEGQLTEVHSILQRVRDLAVQAGNDSNNTDSRAAIKTEVDQLTKELTRISGSANFNGINLLDGSNATLTFQVGAGSVAANDQIAVDLSGANVSTVATAVGALTFDTAGNALTSIAALDTQIKNVSTARANLGAVQNRFESTIRSLNVSQENLSAANSRITDTDMASEMVKYTRSNILSQAGTAMLAQANQSGQGVLQLLR